MIGTIILDRQFELRCSTDESAVASAQRLAGDINGDGPVNIEDLEILASQWLADGSADIFDDGVVNLEDFAVLAADWGATPDPEFKGNQTATTYDQGSLLSNTTYYWRIDEVTAGGTYTGTVWSLTTRL